MNKSRKEGDERYRSKIVRMQCTYIVRRRRIHKFKTPKKDKHSLKIMRKI